MKQTYTLPDGTTTAYWKGSYKKWRAIAEPIERALSLEAHGYDPDLWLIDLQTGQEIQLPRWFAVRLADYLRAA